MKGGVKMKLDKAFYWLAILTSGILLALPAIVPICPIEAKPMRCFFTFQSEFLFALLSFIIAISLFFTTESEAKRLSGSFLFFIGIIIFILPFSWSLGICGHNDSPCHLTAALTKGISIVLSVIGAWIAVRKNPVSDEA